MASGGRNEMYSRAQHGPGSGGGWGGHTMSKSFTQLHVDSEYPRMGVQGTPGPGPQQTSAKVRYVGTGPGHSRRYDDGKPPHSTVPRDGYQRDTLVRDHNVPNHRDSPGQGDGGGLKKWGTVSLAENRTNGPSRAEAPPAMPSQDQGFYTRSVSYSTVNSPVPRPMLPFQSYQKPAGLEAKADPQGAAIRTKSVHTTDGRVHARMVAVTESQHDTRPDTRFNARIDTRPDPRSEPRPEGSRTDMRLVGPGSPPPHSPVVLQQRARPVSSPEGLILDVELHVYDYIRHFCPKEVNNIKNIYKLRELVQLKPEIPTLELTELITTFEKNLIRERVDIGRIVDLRLLRQKLEEDFRALMTPIDNNTVEIVCEKQQIDRLKSFIHTQATAGPNVIHPVTVAAISHQYASQPAPDSRSKFAPKGYLIYGMLKVYLHVCDITTLHVDMIVSPATPQLKHESGVSKAIFDAGGPALLTACDTLVQKTGPVPVGEIAQTTSGALPCGSVVHAVGPRWPSHPNPQQREDTLQLLRTAYDNVMAFTCTSGVETIALPSISTGVHGVPENYVAEAIYGALVTSVLKFFFHEENNLKELHVVDIDTDVLRALYELFHNGCQAEGPEVLRPLPESATLTAVSSAKSTREHRLPPLHLSHSTYNTSQPRPEYSLDQAHLPQSRNNTRQETTELQAGPVLASYVRHVEQDGPLSFSPRGYLMFGMFKVFIHTSNILDMEVDAIVHPGNSQLSHYSGEAVAIAVAAGPQMGSAVDEVLRARGTLPVGYVLSTPAGRLPCNSVLHVVVPQWPREQDELLARRCLEDLRKAFDNVMEDVCRSGIQTVAIPVDPGLYQIPFPDVVEILYESIHNQLREHFFKSPNLREVHLVHESANILVPFVELFEHDVRTSDARGASISALEREHVIEAWLKRNKTASLNAGVYQSMERQNAVRQHVQHTTTQEGGRREAQTWGRDSNSAHSSDGIDASPVQPGHKKVTIKQKASTIFSCCYSNRKPPAKHQISVIEHPHYQENRGQPTRTTDNVPNGGPTATYTIHPRGSQENTANDYTVRSQQSTQYIPRERNQMTDPEEFRHTQVIQGRPQHASMHNPAVPGQLAHRGPLPNVQSETAQPGNYGSLARPEPSQDLVVRSSYHNPAPGSSNQYNVRTAHIEREQNQYNVSVAHMERETNQYNVRSSNTQPTQYSVRSAQREVPNNRTAQADPAWQVNTIDKTSRAAQEMSRAPPATSRDVIPRGQTGASHQGNRNYAYEENRYGRQSMPY